MWMMTGVAVALVAVVAGVPLASFLPYASILVCGLMMFFTMRTVQR